MEIIVGLLGNVMSGLGEEKHSGYQAVAGHNRPVVTTP